MALSSTDFDAWMALVKLLDEIDQSFEQTDEVYCAEQDEGCGGL